MWYDRNISAGAEWKVEIDNHIETAKIILLLISPDFMNSEYCYGIEMKRALERHASGEARVIPIILRPVYWQTEPFNKLQALPTDGRAVVKWSIRDEAFLDISQGIRNTIKVISKISKSDNKENTILSNKNDLDLTSTIKMSPEDINAYKESLSSLTTDRLPYVESNLSPLLCIKQNGEIWQVHEITGELRIGRHSRSDIFLEDKLVSRNQAIIYIDSDRNCILKDSGSANGTIVNGKILRKNEIHILNRGDVIQMGQTILVFNLGHDF